MNKYLFSTIIAFIFFSCEEKKTVFTGMDDCDVIAAWKVVNGDTVIISNVHDIKDTLNLPLSYFTEGFELVRLDNTKVDALVSRDRPMAVISDNYIGFFCYQFFPFKLFDRKGNYLRDIGAFGQGPNEYSDVSTAQIDEKNNRIFIAEYASYKNILVYDLEGNHLPSIPLAYSNRKMTFYIDMEKQTVFVGSTTYSDTPIIWIQDFEGNVIQEFRNNSFGNDNPIRSNNILQLGWHTENIAISYDFNNPDYQILYNYNQEKNEIIPKFQLLNKGGGFSMRELPYHFIYETLTVGGYGGEDIIIDKETLKGCYFNLVIDEFGDMPVSPSLFYYQYNSDYFYITKQPYDFIEDLDRVLAAPGKLSPDALKKAQNLRESLDEDDNCIIIITKLKK